VPVFLRPTPAPSCPAPSRAPPSTGRPRPMPSSGVAVVAMLPLGLLGGLRPRVQPRALRGRGTLGGLAGALAGEGRGRRRPGGSPRDPPARGARGGLRKQAGRGPRRLRLSALVALLAGQDVATLLTIGPGGSGGVFAPSLFLGTLLGGAFGQALAHLVPGLAGPWALYAVAEIGDVFADAAQAPRTAVVIGLETAGDHSLTAGVATACVVAYLVHGLFARDALYAVRLSRRGIRVLRGAAARPLCPSRPPSNRRAARLREGRALGRPRGRATPRAGQGRGTCRRPRVLSDRSTPTPRRARAAAVGARAPSGTTSAARSSPSDPEPARCRSAAGTRRRRTRRAGLCATLGGRGQTTGGASHAARNSPGKTRSVAPTPPGPLGARSCCPPLACAIGGGTCCHDDAGVAGGRDGAARHRSRRASAPPAGTPRRRGARPAAERGADPVAASSPDLPGRGAPCPSRRSSTIPGHPEGRPRRAPLPRRRLRNRQGPIAARSSTPLGAMGQQPADGYGEARLGTGSGSGAGSPGPVQKVGVEQTATRRNEGRLLRQACTWRGASCRRRTASPGGPGRRPTAERQLPLAVGPRDRPEDGSAPHPCGA
jgi:hypothetical protein